MSGALSGVGENLKMAYEFARKKSITTAELNHWEAPNWNLFTETSRATPRLALQKRKGSSSRRMLSLCWALSHPVAYTQTEVAERYQTPFWNPPQQWTKSRREVQICLQNHRPSYWAEEQIKFIKDMQDKTNLPIKNLALIYENTDQGAVHRQGLA